MEIENIIKTTTYVQLVDEEFEVRARVVKKSKKNTKKYDITIA